MHIPTYKHKSKSGMTLIETMLAVGLLGVVTIMGVKALSSSSHMQEHVAVKGEVEDIRDLLRASFDCAATVDNQTSLCNASDYVELRKADGSQLVSQKSPHTELGEGVELRSKCIPDDGFYKMNMEFRRTHNGKVVKNHLTGKTYDWAPLFPNVPVTCPKPECMTSSLPKPPTKLDFESIPGIAQGMDIDNAMNTYLRKAYGIRFKAIDGGGLKFARVTLQNEPEATFYGWMSVLCPGNPSYNRLCNGGDSGRWLLSSADSVKTNRIEFEVIYDFPAQDVSFDLADFDGGEVWTITPYDVSDKVIGSPVVFKGDSGYGASSGNNALLKLEISSKSKNIRKLNLTGNKSINIFGFGFDNFSTGIEYCK